MAFPDSSDTEVEVISELECARGMGSGEGLSLPQRGSRAKPAPSRLRRSAAFRGRSPREEGVQGEETRNLWIVARAASHRLAHALRVACEGLLIPRELEFVLASPASREHRRARGGDHATVSSISAGVRYPSEE